MVDYDRTSGAVGGAAEGVAVKPATEERSFVADLVLLVLFVVLAMVVGRLFLLYAGMD